MWINRLYYIMASFGQRRKQYETYGKQEYHAFAPDNRKYGIKIGKAEKYPYMIADHSVIYLPLENQQIIALFNGASAWDKLKGIKDESPINKLNSEALNELKKEDKKLMSELADLIYKELKVEKIIKLAEKDAEGKPKEVKISDLFKLKGDIAIGFAKSGCEKDIEYLFKDKENYDEALGFATKMIDECKKSIESLKGKNIEIIPNEADLGTNEKVKNFLKIKKGYYIFQIPGTFLNTQPFGGFNFTDGKDEIYNTKDAFKKYLEDVFKLSDNYAVELENSGLKQEKFRHTIPKKGKTPEIITINNTDLKAKIFHLDSSGATVKDLREIISGAERPNIIMGDSNLTVSKLGKDKDFSSGATKFVDKYP